MSNMQARQATIHRKTSETDIELFLCLDGEGNAQVDTGIGFFDHMLKSFSKHDTNIFNSMVAVND